MEKPRADHLSLGDPALPAPYSTWRHCKGDIYMVAAIALDPDGAPCVVYQGANRPQLFVQTAERFLGIHPGLNRPRFERV